MNRYKVTIVFEILAEDKTEATDYIENLIQEAHETSAVSVLESAFTIVDGEMEVALP